MTAVDPILLEVTSAPITATVASTGLVLTVASGTVGPAGPTGPAGSNGTNGVGVPAGGTTGQVLAKTSATNYATAWVDQTGGGGGGSGTVTEVSGTAPISVATGTTTPVVSISAATTSAAGSMSSSDKAKLDGIAAGATANATDAQLRDRSTHTGTQTLSTISDAGTAAAKNAPATGNASSTEVVLGSDSRLTDARTPSSTLSHASTHGAAGSDPVSIAQSQVANLTTDLAGKVPTSRTVNGKALSADVTLTASDLSLATIATSGSASDLSAGTVPTARLASKVVGGQDEGTGVALSATAASLLDSTVTLPACAAGDLVVVAGSFTVLNNSTASRSYTVNLKLGATNVCAVSAGSVSNGTTRSFMFQAYVRVEGASDLNATTFVAHSLNGGASTVANAAGVATENIGGGSLALDLTVASSTGTATQTGTLESLTVTRIAA